jgi:hypothetical protein
MQHAHIGERRRRGLQDQPASVSIVTQQSIGNPEDGVVATEFEFAAEMRRWFPLLRWVVRPIGTEAIVVVTSTVDNYRIQFSAQVHRGKVKFDSSAICDRIFREWEPPFSTSETEIDGPGLESVIAELRDEKSLMQHPLHNELLWPVSDLVERLEFIKTDIEHYVMTSNDPRYKHCSRQAVRLCKSRYLLIGQALIQFHRQWSQ